MTKGDAYREEQLLLLLAEGDQQAFSALYEQTYPLLYYSVKRYVGEEEARDIVAECYVKLLRTPRKFDNIAHFYSYMRTVARNACFDLLQRTKRETTLLEQIAHLTGEKEDAPDQRTEWEAMLYKRILDEIEKLPPFTRQIFQLSYLEGRSNPEICQLLNIKDQTVRNKKAEALKQIRLKLAVWIPFFYLARFFFKL